MRAGRFIVFLLLIVSYGAAYATILQTPKPAPFVECDNQYPDGLIGIWRVDHDWTDHEDPYTNTTAVAPGEGDLSTVTFTRNSYVSHIPNVGKIERTYQIVGGSAKRYTLEFTDRSGAALVTTLELVPCGLMMEQIEFCLDTFCRNFIEEVIRTSYENSGQVYDEEEVQRLVEQVMQAQAPQPQSPRRIYYRRVAGEITRTQGVMQQ